MYGKWDCVVLFLMLVEILDDMLGLKVIIYLLGFKIDFNLDKIWLGLGRLCNIFIRIIILKFFFRLE